MARQHFKHDTWLDPEEYAYPAGSLRQSHRRFRAIIDRSEGTWVSTDYVTGYAGVADTYFTIPARTTFRGQTLHGFLTMGSDERGKTEGTLLFVVPKTHKQPKTNPPLTRVKVVGPNMTEIRHGEITALYSYETPVALDTPSGLYRTATHFSNTTARHISKWGAKTAPKISQEKIELAIQRGVDPQTLGAERGPRRNPGDVHIDIDSHKQNPARIAYRVGEVKIYWDSALKEYEVVGKGEQRGNGYFTSDKQDAIDTAKTIAGGHQPNPGKFNDTVEELLYVVDHDQTMGDASGPLGWMGLVSGLLLPEANELAKFHGIELDDSDTADYDWPLNAIIIEDDQGFIDVTTYKSNREAIRVWRELEKELEGFETE